MLCSNCQKIALRTKTAQARGLCSYCTPHPSGRPKAGRPTPTQYTAAATKKYPSVHIREDAKVESHVAGAYVQAWVWVSREEA